MGWEFQLCLWWHWKAAEGCRVTQRAPSQDGQECSLQLAQLSRGQCSKSSYRSVYPATFIPANPARMNAADLGRIFPTRSIPAAASPCSSSSSSSSNSAAAPNLYLEAVPDPPLLHSPPVCITNIDSIIFQSIYKSLINNSVLFQFCLELGHFGDL